MKRAVAEQEQAERDEEKLHRVIHERDALLIENARLKLETQDLREVNAQLEAIAEALK